MNKDVFNMFKKNTRYLTDTVDKQPNCMLCKSFNDKYEWEGNELISVIKYCKQKRKVDAKDCCDYDER